MNIQKALQIYNDSIKYGLAEDILIDMEGLNFNEYQKLIKEFFKSEKSEDNFDIEQDTEIYRDYQQANFDEYFDPARTYKYCLF